MLLAIDVGSSSVKAAVLHGDRVVAQVASAAFDTDFSDGRAEVPVGRIEAAIRTAVARLDLSAIASVGLAGMGPAWLAMDGDGRAITPLVTHQDRRSIDQARRIETTVGCERHLQLAGNRPTPGGISSTTAAWFAENTDALDRATMLGHLPTYLARKLTGAWVMDPSNAGFTGLMDVGTGGWSAELCDAADVPMEKLPPIRDAGDTIGVTGDNDLAIPPGVALFGGFIDGSGAILLAGAMPGTLIHSAGSTDVLALCVDGPAPREGLLCRPLGTRGLWVVAATLSSGGSSLAWARRMLFASHDDAAFEAECRAAMAEPDRGVRFDPRLAGDRQSVEQPTGGFEGITLGTERRDLLRAVLVGLADSCAQRFQRLQALGRPMSNEIVVTGGLEFVADVLHRDLPREMTRRRIEEATLRGMACLRHEPK